MDGPTQPILDGAAVLMSLGTIVILAYASGLIRGLKERSEIIFIGGSDDRPTSAGGLGCLALLIIVALLVFAGL